MRSSVIKIEYEFIYMTVIFLRSLFIMSDVIQWFEFRDRDSNESVDDNGLIQKSYQSSSQRYVLDFR